MTCTLRRPHFRLRRFAGIVTPGCLAFAFLIAATANAQQSPSPTPDPRVGLRAGLWDAAQAEWNLKLVSTTRPSAKFLGSTNSDLAFTGPYAIQGSYNGYQVWDLSNPTAPTLKTAYFCPASQSDVSVYKNLLFVSGEGTSGRLDCSAEGVKDTASAARLRGLRIFDISDITNPKYVANVQTCRGSHTHTVVADPNDRDNVYVYISGSAGVRPASELSGCVKVAPDKDPNSALFRIEVIKVPLAHPELAAIVSSPRIFNDLTAPASHDEAPEDIAAAKTAAAAERARGGFTANVFGLERVVPPTFIAPMLDSVVHARGGTGAPTAADSTALRGALQGILDKMFGVGEKTGPTQCHDITVYPAIGLAGGACEGYGLLLDIHDPTHPVRLQAAADSNFSYWHSATFNNDGTKILFSDEWGGGGQPKCRATDKHEWGADAIFTLTDRQMHFQSYYKMPAAQTPQENCVAHNGSLIPIPGRDVMVQAWYQGGISVFDFTDAAHPKEIAFFDRGPIDSTHMGLGGTWSAYWYNGVIVGSEIARGLDVYALTPSAFLSQNEIDAAKSVHFDQFNTQGQPKIVWPATFSLARAYVDQLARSNTIVTAQWVGDMRQTLDKAEAATGTQRRDILTRAATTAASAAGGGNASVGGVTDPARLRSLEATLRSLAAAR